MDLLGMIKINVNTKVRYLKMIMLVITSFNDMELDEVFLNIYMIG